MDEVKHPPTETAEQIDVLSVRNCLKHGDAKLALQYCYKLLDSDPQHIQTLLFTAIAFRSLGRFDDALSSVNRALALEPNQPEIHSLMGDILLLQNRPEQAVCALLRANKLGDASAQLFFNIGSAYLALANYEDAKIYCNQALAIDPQMVVAHVNKGLVEHSLMNLDAALQCFDAALSIDPENIDAQWNKSHVLLTLGRYKEGLKLYETRWKHQQLELKKRSFCSKLWLGRENLSDKVILLYAEGGFGDTIQFIRYAKLFDPDVNLVIQCQVPLIEIVESMGLGAEVIALGDTPPPHDFHCPMMSLPLAYGTTIETVPNYDRYLYAPDRHVKKWGAFIGQLPGPKIGIAARGSRSHANDRNRSLTLKFLVAQLPKNASYILLQKDITNDERAFIDSCDNIIAPDKALESFSDTAAICAHLDQVISVDTAVAHLSAALGRPTTVLLAYRPDWRWGAEGERTVWYPNASLIRGTQTGRWGDALSTWHMDCLQDSR